METIVIIALLLLLSAAVLATYYALRSPTHPSHHPNPLPHPPGHPSPILPSPISLPASTSPPFTLVFLHGLGDSGASWSDRVASWTSSPTLPSPLSAFLPSAAPRPVSAMMGISLPAWYDVLSADMDGPQDPHSVADTARALAAWIDATIAPSPGDWSSIILGGFSQGGAMALYMALDALLPLARDPQSSQHVPYLPAGVIVLSGYLPIHHRFQPLHNPSLSSISDPPLLPIFQAHGDRDDVVPFAAGVKTARALDTCPLTDVSFFTIRGVSHSSPVSIDASLLTWLSSLPIPSFVESDDDLFIV